jgi:spermidine/putrescine transport system substrate-binding protein
MEPEVLIPDYMENSTMKKLQSLSMSLLVVMLAACAPALPKIISKELNLYAFSEYVPQDLIDGFEKETGVTVNYESYATNEEMTAGMQNAPGKYDVIVPSDYAVEQLIQSGSLRALDLSLIPNSKNINKDFLHPFFDPGGETGNADKKYSVPYLWGTTGIVYNRSKISTPITSWSDLWRPELSGHIVVLDDSREMMGVALLSLGYDKNETNLAKLAEARDKLKKLAPGIVAFDAETPEDYLLSGEAWVGVVYNGNAALAERQDPDLIYTLPTEGAGFWIDNMAIPVDAPHSDAAIAFVNYVLDSKNGALLIRDYPYSTPNDGTLNYLEASDVVFYNSYTKSLASNPPEDALLKAKLVRNIDPESAAVYDQFWAEVTSSQ